MVLEYSYGGKEIGDKVKDLKLIQLRGLCVQKAN